MATDLAGTRYEFNPSSFEAPSSYQPMGSFSDYSSGLGGGGINFGTSSAGSAVLPGQMQESPLDRAARIGSIIGETAHGVGNVVRAFRGMDPIRYPGQTLAQQAQAAKSQRMREQLLAQLLGGGSTPAQDAQMSGETAGTEVEAGEVDSGAPIDTGTPEYTDEDIANDVAAGEMFANTLLEEAKRRKRDPAASSTNPSGPTPQQESALSSGFPADSGF